MIIRLTHTKSRRKGFINSVELLFLSPIILVLLLALVQFSLMLTTQAILANAAREGARVSATGGTQEDAKKAIKKVLGEFRFKQVNIIFVPNYSLGDPLVPGESVEVRIEVRACQVVPDFLGFFGLPVGRKCLVGRAVMRVE